MASPRGAPGQNNASSKASLSSASSFNAITKSAIQEAMAHPREIDGQLVDAYLARRALDYLFGYSLSPVLWRKLPGARSAGRVQSVALRIICEREIEIEAFKNQEYWTVDTLLKTPSGDALTARLVKLNGEKLDKFSLPNEAAAADARKRDRSRQVRGRQRRVETRTPQPVPALHDLDLAAGGRAQAGLLGQPHDARRPAPL